MGLMYVCEKCDRDIRPYDGQIERPQPCRQCLEAEIERLQAERDMYQSAWEECRNIIDKLPKTADGVLVVLGMKLYSRYDNNVVAEGLVPLAIIISTSVGRYYARWVNVKDCYSTREAAEAGGDDE